MSSETTRIKVLYAGDGYSLNMSYITGYDVYISSNEVCYKHLEDALRKDAEIDLTRLFGLAVGDNFPKTMQELKKFDVIVLSDVGSDTLLLYSEIMMGKRGVDRLKILRDYVHEGGGFLMCGGYSSFAGYRGSGRYGGTPIEELLPVQIKDGDDRVEMNEGFSFQVIKPNHPIMKNIPWKEADYYLLGYQRLKAKKEAEVLATYNDDPIIAVWHFGEGRSMAFASDVAPHWVGSFSEWKYYGEFWIRVIRWLARRLNVS